MDCLWCFSTSKDMRCGPEVICKLLLEAIPLITVHDNIGIKIFLALFFSSYIVFCLTVLILRRFKDDKYCVVVSYIILIISAILCFPLSLFVWLCLRKRNVFPIVRCCKCCQKKNYQANYRVPQQNVNSEAG
jgi:hypothetical protein